MDVKAAIARAREYLQTVFSEENISEVRLEEVSFDRNDNSWLVTFGLLRPSARTRQDRISEMMTPALMPLKRSYKIVRIPSDEFDQPSIRIRELADE